jgi:peptidoglycan lytic transglycosylase
VTALADRYTGRHQRQARHGAWVNKKRSRVKPSSQFLPAAAAVTVAGFLFGGAGAAIHFSPASSDTDLSVKYDPADLPPPDRNAERASRTDNRSEIPGSIEVPANGIAGVPLPKVLVPANGTAQTVIGEGACQATYFDQTQLTASGELTSPDELTAANKDLPFNSLVRVTNPDNGQSVVVRINDRGPYVGADRCLDLSESAFSSIASLGEGVVDVRYEVLAQDAT